MMREDVYNHLAVLDPAAGWNLAAQYGLLAVVMHPGTKNETASLSRPIKRPAGEASGYFLHILLSVAAFDSERVKLHDFAGVVLVDSGFAIPQLIRVFLLGLILHSLVLDSLLVRFIA